MGIGETKQKNNCRASGKLEFLWGKDLCCEAVRNPRALSQCVHFAMEGAMSFLWSRLYFDGQSTRGWRKPLRMITWVLCPAYSQKKMPWKSLELLLFCLSAMKTREMLLVAEQLNQRTSVVLGKSSLWCFLVLSTICPFFFLERSSDRSASLVDTTQHLHNIVCGLSWSDTASSVHSSGCRWSSRLSPTWTWLTRLLAGLYSC